MFDLPFLNEVLDCSRHVFDRHVRINAMLIEEVDDIGFEARERRLSDFSYLLRPAVESSDFAGFAVEMESELGGDDHVGAKRSESFAHEFFICEWAVGFSGIEERDAAFHGHPEDSDHLLLILRGTVPEAHSHAAEAQSRDFETALSKRSPLHHGSIRHISS